jgi:DNA-binding CsgD family transcriptional regulator
MIKLLTQREDAVAALITEGLSNKLIADKLDISEHTAKFHVANVCQKFGTTSRVVVAVEYTLAKLLCSMNPNTCASCEARRLRGGMVDRHV